ncbi:bifunctional demethylmenaquinone methyltransferase/2-methoxy-6-polyprenyl-1,4-benzoquinol methylase UbiE [Puniceicoccaceae bacterium K14]|nr:bifunctional demethylmenaquinone methyltransferase/2-methoxy-6-polyprenyl-1,4-benzoquinol methylase UbiE [Puniceicoccaceae bacterium K14]
MPEASKVNSMFGRIAEKYDLANRVLSFGIDRQWRRELVAEAQDAQPKTVVDLATGSGDVAFALEKALPPETEIIGMDFCLPMLEEAEKKKTGFESKIAFKHGDALDLPLKDNSVDLVTISFGFRNFEDRAQGLREIQRVLKKGTGRLLILEFSQPHPLYRPFYYFYLKNLLPMIAGFCTGDKAAYNYLSDSIEAFPDRQGISKEMKTQGFKVLDAIPMTLGSVALHVGQA